MPETQEVDHMGNPAFRTKKRIFATLRVLEGTANFKFTPLEQAAFCQADKISFSPVKGGWGNQGWTTVNLKKIKKEMLKEAITSAWYDAAPDKVQEQFRKNRNLD
ncbi:MmcQ/YjbR family DNA-binding protein [Flavitalea flava]